MVTDRRWEHAIHFRPDTSDTFIEFWTERLRQKRDILIITGLGWDPRMTALPRVLQKLSNGGLRDIHLIRYRPSKVYRSQHKRFLDKNEGELKKVIDGWGKEQDIDIITRREGNYYVGDEEISKFYTKYDLNQYTDVIVDISALPKSIYFTLLFVLVEQHDRKYPKLNLHVVACQDVELDGKIFESADDTRWLKGFRSNFNRVSQQAVTRIWAPVLEKNYSASLRKLYDHIGPNDIYPILPFPSRNPRTDDDLLTEYRDIFVDEWNLNPFNIMYADEDNPLDVYRILLNLLHRQTEALLPLGGAYLAVSALSSKLSSIGAFMAAFEGKMAVSHAIGRHDPPEDIENYWNDKTMSSFEKSLHCIWLTGEPYD